MYVHLYYIIKYTLHLKTSTLCFNVLLSLTNPTLFNYELLRAKLHLLPKTLEACKKYLTNLKFIKGLLNKAKKFRVDLARPIYPNVCFVANTYFGVLIFKNTSALPLSSDCVLN